MNFYQALEKPNFYNLIEKILSLGREPIKNYLLQEIKPKNGEKILDVGCGTGRYAVFSGNYVGIDINPGYIKYAQNKHEGTFQVMDATDLKFLADSFDYIFTVGVFHHISDTQVEGVIREMKKVCKQGGKIFVIDPVFPSKLNFLGYLLFKLDRGKYTRTFNRLHGLLTKHEFRLLEKKIKGVFPYRVPPFFYQKP